MKKFFHHFEEYIAAAVFIVMLALTFANVVMRNFAAAISFTEEITSSLFVLLCMMGTAIAARDQAHLGLSVVTEFIHPRKRAMVTAVGNLLGVVFSLILIKTGVEMVILEYEMEQISIALQWPQWIYGSFLPFGAVCMAVRFAQAMLENLKTYKSMGEEK